MSELKGPVIIVDGKVDDNDDGLKTLQADFDAVGVTSLAVPNLESLASACDDADRKSTRLNSSHWNKSRMPSSA